MKAFSGTFVNKIDAKGRISVPADFRLVLQGRGLTGVALYPAVNGDCLEGCGTDRIEALTASMPDDPLRGFQQDAIEQLIIGMARPLLFDGGGRIVLPEDFMTEARLTNEGAFVGRGHIFQLWEPAALAEERSALKKRLIAARRAELEKGSQ